MPGKYRAVSTAEKRALLEAAGEEWPACECHRSPLKWSKMSDRKSGGAWHGCSVANRERMRRLRETTYGAIEAERRRERARSPSWQAARALERRAWIARKTREGVNPNTIRNRMIANTRDQKKIDELMQLLPPHQREILNEQTV